MTEALRRALEQASASRLIPVTLVPLFDSLDEYRLSTAIVALEKRDLDLVAELVRTRALPAETPIFQGRPSQPADARADSYCYWRFDPHAAIIDADGCHDPVIVIGAFGDVASQARSYDQGSMLVAGEPVYGGRRRTTPIYGAWKRWGGREFLSFCAVTRC